MLLDAVGMSVSDASGFLYYLKHRAPGQVDAEGKPTSTVLGSLDLTGSQDEFAYWVTGNDDDFRHPRIAHWEMDYVQRMPPRHRNRNGLEMDAVWGTWCYARRAIIYADEAMKNQIGVCRRARVHCSRPSLLLGRLTALRARLCGARACRLARGGGLGHVSPYAQGGEGGRSGRS